MKLSKELLNEFSNVAIKSAKYYYFANVTPYDYLDQRIEVFCSFMQELNSLNVADGLPTLVNILSQCTQDEKEKIMPIFKAAIVITKYYDMLGLATSWIEDLDEIFKSQALFEFQKKQK